MIEERAFDWDGRRVFYAEAGAGPPLVFVHGHATSHFTWRNQLSGLADGFRVLAPDLLGFGKSEKRRDLAYTTDLWVDQIAAFLQTVAKGPVVLAGNSLGGLIAAFVADRHPKLVEKLVLIASAGASSYAQSTLVNFPFLLMRTPVLGRSLFETVVQRRFVDWNIRNRLYANPDVVTEAVIAHYHECFFAEENREIVFEVTKSFYDFIMTDEVSRRITQPTLLLWGEKDTFVPPMRGRQLERVMPNARLEVIPKASHCPQEDQPELVNRFIREFAANG